MTDREAILEAIRAFKHAYDAADLDRLLACYDDDLIKTRAGGPPETKKETARRLREVFDRFETTVDVDNVELEIDGDLAFARGAFVVTLAPRAGGDRRRIARRYLEIWRRRSGGWKVWRTMDNEGDP